ncbi:PEP motif putative anchor domain protein [Gemmatirosa kalamazoonensis]|uniref:PEP motif putative anchor domain protein n=1 Tax=Gemmatirosa kalamazoonensis TaxID=861299 RepID=W0RGM4_9BACT|nr:PEP-CTERM sorting domain-containing protein [Gemmatirosa kalamazoonensis]AHG90229.1 PEP motif putative anchor domain protein [Gemmatirosa kalamazoonensis]
MNRLRRAQQIGLGVAVALFAMASRASAQCLTNAGTQVGNPALGATVGTFIGLGIDPNTTCIENGLWTDPSGFVFGSYVKGAEGAGFGYDPTSLGAYNGANLGSIAANANARDFYWVQDVGGCGSYGGVGGNCPSNGIIWDLGGQANQLAVFVFVDHGPIPLEVLENTAWLSNDPNAADAGWTQASLVHVYGGGWSPDPNIADGFVAVYQLAGGATFRYASVTWGGPGAIQRDGDNEIDAVGGLTARGCGVNGVNCGTVPEPMTTSLLGGGLALLSLGALRRRRA